MSKGDVQLSKTIQITKEELDYLTRCAERLGFMFQSSGKPNVMEYIRHRLLGGGDSINKIDGYDDILAAFNELRKLRNQIPRYLIETKLGEFLQLGSSEEREEDYIEICNELSALKKNFEKIDVAHLTIQKLLAETNKSLEKLREEKNVLH